MWVRMENASKALLIAGGILLSLLILSLLVMLLSSISSSKLKKRIYDNYQKLQNKVDNHFPIDLNVKES